MSYLIYQDVEKIGIRIEEAARVLQLFKAFRDGVLSVEELIKSMKLLSSFAELRYEDQQLHLIVDYVIRKWKIEYPRIHL